MPKHILWLDNDTPYIRPYVNAMKNRDYDVNEVSSLTAAEELMDKHSFDLVIIDVMIPTQTQDEVKRYPDAEIDYGHKTGLVFYQRMKKKFGDKLPTVAVTTVRLDQDIRDEFSKSGLKGENFVTKYSVRDVTTFVAKMESILAAGASS